MATYTETELRRLEAAVDAATEAYDAAPGQARNMGPGSEAWVLASALVAAQTAVDEYATAAWAARQFWARSAAQTARVRRQDRAEQTARGEPHEWYT